MNMAYPIPNSALDDRLAFVGTAGAGKTYNASAAVERVLERHGRVIVADPLGVWWGLRLKADGTTASAFQPVIFGGAHGDLPISEHVGALIGETVAGMAESAVIDLSGLGTKAAERRFMLAMLTALYRHATTEPVHIVFDEADMFAPQRLLDKEGEAAKLLGMMETIVRRGRIKGFIPWLITQRPAVLSKDVLSQADGLIAFKLTSSQDRDAIGDWVQGQADKKVWNDIWASLPTMAQGQGVIWIPGKGILETAQFPAKKTYDSSRTPKRGEVRRHTDLKPIDLGKLKDRLATVEAETKANDPRALKAEIARLMSENRKLINSPKPDTLDPKAIDEAYQKGYAEGSDKILRAVASLAQEISGSIERAEAACSGSKRLVESFAGFVSSQADEISRHPKTVSDIQPRDAARPRPLPPRQQPPASGGGSVSGPEQKLLGALAYWENLGERRPTRAQTAAVAGWRITSGHIKNVCGSLKTKGLIEYPSDGRLALTREGEAVAIAPTGSVQELVRSILDGPQTQVYDLLLKRAHLTREQICDALGWNITSGHIKNVLGSMKTLTLIRYPSAGEVAIEDWAAS